MSHSEYKVRLEAFEGPLDLLLHLVRKAEVDIGAIPLAQIADQYVDHLRGIDRIDIELAGEFLVVAATLLELKSRLLSPPENTADETDVGGGESADALTDPGSELVRKLLEYKKTRDAADELDERAEAWARRGVVGPLGVDAEALRDAAERQIEDVDLEDVGVYDLVEAFAQIIAQVDMSRLGDHHVLLDDDDTPIEEHAEHIVDRLRHATPSELGRRELPLRALFQGKGRGAMIGMFLALLELVRDQRVGVHQDEARAELLLTLNETAGGLSKIGADPIQIEIKPLGPASSRDPIG